MFFLKVLEGITLIAFFTMTFGILFLGPLYIGQHYGGVYTKVFVTVSFLLEFGVLYAIMSSR